VLPSVQEATGASKGALGVALLCTSLGSIPAMFLIAAPAVDRFGARSIAIGCAAFAVAATLPGLAQTVPGLMLALVAAGAGSGLLDVAMNASAGRIETATGRRFQPLAHGLYSVGVLVGAVTAGVARSAGVSREPILAAVAVFTIAVGVLALTDPAPIHVERRPGIRLARGLFTVGLLAAAAFLVEGGSEAWSAIFLERQLHAHPAISGLGPGIFGGAMAAGRFAGQAAQRVSGAALVGGGCLLAAGGCLVVAAAPSPAFGILGFALVGAGISLNAPILFGFAARRPDAGASVATVTTIGYTGLLAGPALIGVIAQPTSLRVSFVVLAGVAAAVAATATRMHFD
jgi:MFS family permease